MSERLVQDIVAHSTSMLLLIHPKQENRLVSQLRICFVDISRHCPDHNGNMALVSKIEFYRIARVTNS